MKGEYILQGIFKKYPVLRNVKFVYFLFGNMVSIIGNQFNVLAISLVLYDVTGNVKAIAGMWAARVISRLIVQPLAGPFIDKLNKKRILVITNILSSIIVLGFLFINKETIWLVYVLTFLLQSVEGFLSPALGASFPLLLSKEQLVSANSLRSTISVTATFIGPAVAGIVYSFIGARFLFIFNSISFLVVLITILPLNINDVKNTKSHEPFFIALKEGLSFCSKNMIILCIFILSLVNSLVWRVMEIILVPASKNLFHIGSEGLGLLFSILSIGSLLGGLIVPWLKLNKITARTIIYIYILSSIPFTALSVFPLPWMAYISMLTLGIVLEIFGIYTKTILQTSVPVNLLGRVFSLLNVVLAIGVLPVLFGLEELVNKIKIPGTIGLCAGVIVISCIGSFLLTLKRGKTLKINRVDKDGTI